MELRGVSSQLGSACQILAINHGSEETPVMDPRFWISSMEGVYVHDGGCACQEDMKQGALP